LWNFLFEYFSKICREKLRLFKTLQEFMNTGAWGSVVVKVLLYKSEVPVPIPGFAGDFFRGI